MKPEFWNVNPLYAVRPWENFLNLLKMHYFGFSCLFTFEFICYFNIWLYSHSQNAVAFKNLGTFGFCFPLARNLRCINVAHISV